MTPTEEHFLELAEALFADPRVSRSTMMRLPCLRWDGRFFAGYDRCSVALVVKLAEARIDDLVGTGQAEPFAPAGRRFKQWASISAARQQLWAEYLTEARRFVAAMNP
jgi:hypothetical protein